MFESDTPAVTSEEHQILTPVVGFKALQQLQGIWEKETTGFSGT